LEAILGLIFLIAIMYGIGWLFGALTNATKGTIKTLTSGGNIGDNIRREFQVMGRFEVQVLPTKIQLEKRLVDAYEVNVRGLLNVASPTDLSIVTSLFDYSNQKHDPVLCAIDDFQEKTTESFQARAEIGRVDPYQGFKNWIKVATIFPEILYGARSGKRLIRVYVRVLPSNQIPKIEYGLEQNNTTVLAFASQDVSIYLKEKGWLEAREDREESVCLIVKMAVSVAVDDGPIKESEAKVIQGWIRHHLNKVSDTDIEKTKVRLNSAFKEAFIDAQSGRLVRNNIIDRLKKIDIKSVNQALLELLVDVIGADSQITPDEMNLVKNIGFQLGIDYNEIKIMSEKVFLDIEVDTQESLEGILGIDQNWSKDQVLLHLSKEFAKWNGRIQALEDHSEKEKAQKMLDAIAILRKKYGAN